MSLRVLFLDPYHGPSHAALSTTLRDRSRNRITLLTLPARKWKWRMRGAALYFERVLRDLPEPPERLVCTDMLNLPELLALARDHLPAGIPVIAYFHENQLTYPLPSRDARDFHFGLVNIHTALCADRVVFNSEFHRREFLEAVPAVLRRMPDHRPEDIVDRIRRRSDVLPVPVPLPARRPGRVAGRLVLWNHRWESDKNPEAFFDAMAELDRRGVDFGLVVLGQSFRDTPACFAEARERLAHRIAHWGYIPSRAEYLDAVSRCRIVVSTARHEFYGLAVREAIARGCYPLLPRRVVYPEMIGDRTEHLYDEETELPGRIATLLADPTQEIDPALLDSIEQASPDRIIPRWDAMLERGGIQSG